MKKNKKALAEYKHQWYIKNKKHVQKLRRKNQARSTRLAKIWRKKNINWYRKRKRIWYSKNKGKIKEQKQQWYAKNRNRIQNQRTEEYAKKMGMTMSEKRRMSASSIEMFARAFVTSLVGCRLVHHPRFIVGHPDYANKCKKVAVFIQGCFWHGCRKHYCFPKTRTDFWVRTIMNTQLRGIEVTKRLQKDGWKVKHVWEHTIKGVMNG